MLVPVLVLAVRAVLPLLDLGGLDGADSAGGWLASDATCPVPLSPAVTDRVVAGALTLPLAVGAAGPPTPST
jgi:hypothetical protein